MRIPFETRIGIPIFSFLSLLPSRRVYQVSIHHMDFYGLLRAREAATIVFASVISGLVPS